MERDLTQLVSAVRRIPLFDGLTPDQARVLLRACERRSVPARQTVCAYGEPANEMFILLSGHLSVRTEKGFQIARIQPVAPVGEMGLFTGEPRSATVVCAEDSTFLVLAKGHLDHMLRRNPDIELLISRRLIRILSQRIRDANRELAHLRDILADQEAGARADRDEGAADGS